MFDKRGTKSDRRCVVSKMKLAAFLVILLHVSWLRPARAQQDLGPLVLPPPQIGVAGTETFGPADASNSLESLLPPQVESIEAGVLLDESREPGGAADDSSLIPAPLWFQREFWLGRDPWDAGVELGINGSEGGNNVFSMRTGGYLKRVTSRWKFDSSLSYNKNHSNGIETQNTGKHDLRLDRILAESPWTLFVLENLIYDEFQSYDIQLSLNTGVGYQWIKSESTDLLTRIGAGATKEFGAVVDDWQPQALFGLDFSRRLSQMQKLTAKVDYFPEWEDFAQYRVVGDVGYQIDLDRPKNVSLKLSLIDRYDSTPNGAEPNNLDYSVLMIWKL